MRKIHSITYYLLSFSAIAFSMPYLVLYYRGLGFSPAVIGLISGVTPVISMVGAPLFTGLADAKGRHRLVMSLTILGTVLLALLFPFARTLLPVLLMIAIFALLIAPIQSFADSATLHMLGDEKEKYGRVRLGGTIGFGVSSALAGVIIQEQGIRWAFWGYAILMLLALLVCQKFTFGSRVGNPSLLRDIRNVFSNPQWRYFLALAFVGGMAFNCVNNFLFPYMEELGISRTTMGFANTLASLSELPVLFFSHHLLRRFGAYGLFVFGMVMMGVRLLLYAWLDFTLGILLFQLINGLTFPLMIVAGVTYAEQNSPSGMKATAQGLFTATMMGIGAGVGGLVGGLLFGILGGQWMYFIIGSLVLVSVGLITTLEKTKRARQARSLT